MFEERELTRNFLKLLYNLRWQFEWLIVHVHGLYLSELLNKLYSKYKEIVSILDLVENCGKTKV